MYAYHAIFANVLGADFEIAQSIGVANNRERFRNLQVYKIAYCVAAAPEDKDNRVIGREIMETPAKFDERIKKLNEIQLFYFATERERVAKVTPNVSSDFTPHASYYSIDAALKDGKA